MKSILNFALQNFYSFVLCEDGQLWTLYSQKDLYPFSTYTCNCNLKGKPINCIYQTESGCLFFRLQHIRRVVNVTSCWPKRKKYFQDMNEKPTDYNYLKGRNRLNLLKLAEYCICHAFSSPDGSIYLHVPSKQLLLCCGNTCYHFDNRREIIPPSYKSQITEGSCSLCFFIILLKTGNFSERLEFINFPGWKKWREMKDGVMKGRETRVVADLCKESQPAQK